MISCYISQDIPLYPVCSSPWWSLCWAIPSLTLICHSFWHHITQKYIYIWYNCIIFCHSILAFYLAFNLTFYSGILSAIYSDILSGIFVASILTFSILACIVLPLWSGACGGGPAGNSLILSLLFAGEHCDLELAVEVRRGSLWSRGCCSGPAGNTAI